MKKSKYALHLSTSYIQMIIGIIIPIILTPYMVSKLGAEMYGVWVLLSSILLYFGLGSLGFGTTLLKEVSKTDDIERINTYLSSMLALLGGMSLILTVIFIVIFSNMDYLFVIPPDILDTVKTTFVVTYLSFLLSFTTGVFGSLLFAKGMLHIQVVIGVVQSILTAFLLFTVLYLGYTIVAMALVNLVLTLFFTSVVIVTAKKRIRFKVSKCYVDLGLLREMTIPSFHYLLITVAAMVILYSDNIVISSFIGLSAVAVYALGYKLVDMSQKILFKLVDIMIPDIAKLYGDGEYEKVLQIHNKVLILSTALGLLGYGILFFWGVDILELWVGEEFTIDTDIFRIFVIFGLFHTWVHVSAIFLVAMGEHKEISYMTILDAILNIVLSIVLLKHYGLWGVAAGTLIAHLVTNGWFTNFWFYRRIRLKIREENKIESNYK